MAPACFVTQFGRPRSGFGAVSVCVRPTKSNSSEGEKYETKVAVVVFYFFLGLIKTETGANTAPRAPKLGYKGRQAPQFSARGTLATAGGGRRGLSVARL